MSSKTAGCTHFTWVGMDKIESICWMKSGNISKYDAFNTKDSKMECGIVSDIVLKKPPLKDI